MNGTGSIFLDFQLPTAATWFYFSGLLAVALFLKFSRLLSVRNWDVFTLFLFTPGFLLLLQARGDDHAALVVLGAGTVGWLGSPLGQGPLLAASALVPAAPYRWGDAWLLIVSAYFLVRCLFDLALVRRPALSPNLNLSGLACLAVALFASLIAVAVQQPRTPPDFAEAAPSPIDEMLVKTLPQTPGEVVGFTVPIGTARALALLCHLSVVVGLVLIGWKHFGDVLSGMAAATFYLLLPYTYLLTPNSALGLGRWDMVWPMAWMVWAVFCYKRPMLAGAFLGVAAGGVLLPVLTLPVWLSFYWKRGAGRFLLSFILCGGATLALAAGVLWAVGYWTQNWHSAEALARWQAWLPPPSNAHGVWQGVYVVYRLPVFIAYAAFVIATLFWPAPKNLAHVLALSAAALIGVQFWCADNGGAYVLWYLPFLLLLVFRPNLTAAQPPPRDDWMKRLARRCARVFLRLFRRRRPARVA
jgi:hypothetical protein